MAVPEIKRPQRKVNVLIIDDSRLESTEYRDAILSNCCSEIAVTVCDGVNQAMDVVSSGQHWDFIILDMMMAHDGTKIDLDLSKNGKFAGVLLAKQIRTMLGDVPVALMSNCTFKEVKDACIQTESVVHNCLHWQKAAMPPTDLARKLDGYFESGKLEKDKISVLKRIFGALLFQPNIAGVGFDVKKAFE